MRGIITVWRMLARRGLANRRLVATLALGMLVAATLLAAAPIYARALADLGLTVAIRDRLIVAPATQVQFTNVAVASEEGRALQAATERRAEERIGWFTVARTRVARGPRFQIVGPGSVPTPAPLAVPWTFTGAGDGADAGGRLHVTAGRLPHARTDGVVEFALAPAAAKAGGLQPGDQVRLMEAFDDCERELPREDRPPPPPCTPSLGVRFGVPAVVTGIVEPANPAASFWVSSPTTLFEPERLIPDAGPLLPALVDEPTFFDGLGGVLPEYRATVQWNFFAGPERLSRANFERAREDIAALRDDLRPVGGVAFGPLETALAGFRRELRYQQAPLLLLLLQLAGIALFYVAIIAVLLTEHQADEIALLRSRGASLAHVAGVTLLEGLTVAVPVVLLAPPLAAAATALLGNLPAFRRVTGGGFLPAHLSAEAFLLSALGGALSLVMLVLPVLVSARVVGVTARRTATRPRPPLLLRYYIDLAVVILAAVLLWELSERGSVFVPGAPGGLSSDPLLLGTPAMLTLAAAALVLRLAPVLLRLAAAIATRLADMAAVLALWRLVRDPGSYTRLALLLMMAIAAGTFAASYGSTAERSFRDRAAFTAGVDLRATVATADSVPPTAMRAALAPVPGVERSSLVLRTTVALATPGSARGDIALLALDPADAAAQLWFRDDLAAVPWPRLLSAIDGPAPPGLPLPGAPTALTVWVNPAEPRPAVTLWARVRDGSGAVVMAEMGKLDFRGWRQMRAPLDDPSMTRLSPPLALVSLVMSEPPTVNVTQTSPVYFDDIGIAGPDGGAVVDDFEAGLRWDVQPARAPARGASVQDGFTLSADQVHGGAASGRFLFRSGPSGGMRGIWSRELTAPVPVVVNPEFAAISGAGVGRPTLLQVGDTLMPVVVRGVARLFPTIQAGTPFVIANREQVAAWLTASSNTDLRRPNEVWLSLAAGTDPAATRAALATLPVRLTIVSDRSEELRLVNSNPLVAAGGSGILLASSLAVFVLVAAALLVTVIAALRRRQTEFAVLRAMGVSRGQVFRSLAVEYSVVATLGVGAGIELGALIGRRMLSFLEVTETGATVSPPFILQTDWRVVGVAAIAVLLTYALGAALSAIAVLRQVAASALRDEG